MAGLLDGAAEVNLRRPVPLERTLEVVREPDGSVRVLDGEALIMDGRSTAEPEVEVPTPVSPSEAGLAATHYRGRSEGFFSRCFVCGRARQDALGVFAGPVEGRELVASSWTPPAWVADGAGQVRPEFIWAVLDCPTYFALYMTGELGLSVLARLTASLKAPVLAAQEQVVIGWPIETDGRKLHAGSAVLSAGGDVLALARALLIEPRA